MMRTLAGKIAVLAVAAAAGAALAGCVSDAAAPASQSSGMQLRYYGGPKYPMWPSGQGTQAE